MYDEKGIITSGVSSEGTTTACCSSWSRKDGPVER